MFYAQNEWKMIIFGLKIQYDDYGNNTYRKTTG